VNNFTFPEIFVSNGKYDRCYSQVTNNRFISKIFKVGGFSIKQKNYQHTNTSYYDYDYYLSNKEKEER